MAHEMRIYNTDDRRHRLEKIVRAEHDPPTRLRLAIKAIVAAATENRALYAVAFSEQTELSNQARERFTTWAHDCTLTFKGLLDECLSGRSGHGWCGVDRHRPHPSRTSRQGLVAWALAGRAIVRRIASLITCGAC